MSNQHIHKYRRINKARKGNPEYWVMACQLPSCMHYVPMASKYSAPAMLNKLAICNKCEEQFQLNYRALRQAFPTCDSCVGINSKEKKKVLEAAAFFDNLSKDIMP